MLERMRRHLEGYDARLRELVRRTRAFGAEPILVTQPTRWARVAGDSLSGVAGAAEYGGVAVNGVDRHRMMRLLDRTLLAVAADSGVRAVDLGGVTDWADSDFYDYAHMTPAGARRLGGRLAASAARIRRSAAWARIRYTVAAGSRSAASRNSLAAPASWPWRSRARPRSP